MSHYLPELEASLRALDDLLRYHPVVPVATPEEVDATQALRELATVVSVPTAPTARPVAVDADAVDALFASLR